MAYSQIKNFRLTCPITLPHNMPYARFPMQIIHIPNTLFIDYIMFCCVNDGPYIVR